MSTDIVEAALKAFPNIRDVIKKVGLNADEISREDLTLLATAYNAGSISNIRNEIAGITKEIHLLRGNFQDEIRLFREDVRPILEEVARKIKESKKL